MCNFHASGECTRQGAEPPAGPPKFSKTLAEGTFPNFLVHATNLGSTFSVAKQIFLDLPYEPSEAP